MTSDEVNAEDDNLQPLFACPQLNCPFWSHRREAVIVHARMKHVELRSVRRSYLRVRRRCPRCLYVSSHLGNMRTHMVARHSTSRPHLCHLCGRSFADKSYYNIHMRRHSKDLRFNCDLCEAKFLKPSHLRSHIAARHQPSSRNMTKTYLMTQIATRKQSWTRLESITGTDAPASNESDRDAAATSDEISTALTLHATSSDARTSSVGGGLNALSGSSSEPVATVDPTIKYKTVTPDNICEDVEARIENVVFAGERVQWEILECIDCNTFFTSFDHLKAHVLEEHATN